MFRFLMLWASSLIALLGSSLVGSTAFAQPRRPPASPTSLFDPRLAELRRASVAWDVRTGPQRQVVDMVCLVPDVAAYYEAIAAWDDRYYFPILIDDVDLTLKFLRAFRPAKVVRYPSQASTTAPGSDWKRAERAVGLSWVGPDSPAVGSPKPPDGSPPGVVVGFPESTSLPGLTALAAGRFQPLVRVDFPKRYPDILDAASLKSFNDLLETSVGSAVKTFARMGDDCDFLTLAGDYPYRYTGRDGLLALDDRIGRKSPEERRWAYVGRLMGDSRRSVYAAMCSLFLQPDSALLFNAYPETDLPWSEYSQVDAVSRLRPILSTKQVAGELRATLKGWHAAFDPWNRSGILFINTKGSPTQFDLFAGPAHALDIMPSVPAVVCIIHSYSAADPTNLGTIAGRWLDQGAFFYHGSMDEPYLNSFRPHALIADLAIEGVPLGAAVRTMLGEPFGQPWKLVVLGDPLYRLRRRGSMPPRTQDFPPSAGWPAYALKPAPDSNANAGDRIAWSVSRSILGEAAGKSDDSVIAVAEAVDRNSLGPISRTARDELLLTLLTRSERLDEARAVYRSIPLVERSQVATRLGISAQLAIFQEALVQGSIERASVLWSELIIVESDRAFKIQITGRAAALMGTPTHRLDWRNRLRSTLSTLNKGDGRDVVFEELSRVEESLRRNR